VHIGRLHFSHDPHTWFWREAAPVEAAEGGIANPSDATLKERVAGVKNERDIAQVAFDRAPRRNAARGADHAGEDRAIR
jgi:hypothetical protein